MPEAAVPAVPNPTEGGSFSRDPVTGELVRLSPKPVQAPAQSQKPEELRVQPAPDSDETSTTQE